MGSVKKITPYSTDGNPGCFTGDLSLAAKLPPTIVIVHGAGTCRDSAHNDLGVVFCGSEPVLWTCLSDAEIPSFQAWSQGNFPGAPVLDVTTVIAHVNCPPPGSLVDVQLQAATEMRAQLTSLGQVWLASAVLPVAPKPAA